MTIQFDMINYMIKYLLVSSLSTPVINWVCEITLVIQNCGANEIYDMKISKLYQTKITGYYKSNCPRTSHSIEWVVRSPKNKLILKKDGPEVYVTIDPFYLQSGRNVLWLSVKEYFAGLEINSQTNVQLEYPIALIEGGSLRKVKANVAFILDASGSIDLETKPGKTPNLNFKWNCNSSSSSNDFCSKDIQKMTSPILKVDKKYAVPGMSFQFSLTINTPGKNNYATAHQNIIVSKSAVIEASITCEKNCEPAALFPNPEMVTVMIVKTNRQYNQISYSWTVENHPDFDYNKWTQTGRDQKQFIIKQNVLKYNSLYSFRVTITDDEDEFVTGSTTFQFTVPPLPTLKGCKVIPSEGTELETKFTIKDCIYNKTTLKTSDNFYIYAGKNPSSAVLLASAVYPEQFKLFLVAKETIILQLTDKYFFETSMILDVKVKHHPRKDNITEAIRNESQNIKELISTGVVQEAVQIISTFTNDVENDKNLTTQEIGNIQAFLLECIDEMKVENIKDIEVIGNIVNQVLEVSSPAGDPNIGSQATNICKKMANRLEEFVDQQTFEDEMYNLNNVTANILKCGDKELAPNESIISNDSYIITTPFPLITSIDNMVEDYEDYDDIYKEDLLENYFNITSHKIEICERITKTMLRVMQRGEDTTTSKTTYCYAFATKIRGKNLAIRDFSYHTLEIGHTRNFKSTKTSVEISVCVWICDIFWWRKKRLQSVTDIAFIKIQNSQISIFTVPFRIAFKVVSKFNITDHIFDIGQRKYDDKDIFLIRIEVPAEQNFVIEMDGMDNDMNISITYFKKPGVEDVIVPAYKQRYIDWVNPTDGWWYLGMFKPKSPQKITIRIYSIGCFEWNNNIFDWDFACRGKPTRFSREFIHCLCSYLSVFSGHVHDNVIKEEDPIISYEWSMKLEASYIILIVTVAVFFCYILMLLIFGSPKFTRYLYFLSDIPESDKYPFIVIVRTGWRHNAGTTSNICIQLLGTIKKSRPYVLNFPDPELRLLQRKSEDWFYMDTSGRLGDILRIRLWSDFIGRNPQWYCREIVVHDILEDKSWRYPVHKWFSLKRDNDISYVIQQQPKLIRHVGYFERCTGLILANPDYGTLPRYLKWSIILAIILTIYILNIICIGVPKLYLNDCFQNPAVGENFYLWLNSIITSIVTFIIFWILIYFSLNIKENQPIEEDTDEEDKKKSNRCIFLEIVIFPYCIFSLSILIIFGFWIPVEVGIYWLISSHIAIVLYFLVLHNIYAFFRKTEEKGIDVELPFNESIPAVEPQRKYLYDNFGPTLLREYLTHLYSEPTDEVRTGKKSRFLDRVLIIELVQDIIMLLIYIVFLYLVVSGDRTELAYYSHQNILSTVKGEYTHTESAEDISSIEQIYEYLNNTLIPLMQSQLWYGNYLVNDAGLVKNFHEKSLGIVRLRQHRVVASSCQLSQCMYNVAKFLSCDGEYSSKPELKNITNHINPYDRMGAIWNYTSEVEAGSGKYKGQITTYPGGGFIAFLGRTLRNSLVNLRYLKERQWINHCMRGIFIEYLIYNCNCNIFNSVTVTIEKSATGYYNTRIEVDTKQLIFVAGEERLMYHIVQLGFFICLTFFTFKVIKRIFGGQKIALKDFWHLVDIFIITINYICVTLYIERMKQVGLFMDTLESVKHNVFVNYFPTFTIGYILMTFAGILVTVVTIRLWKLLRVGTIFRIMEKTIIDSLIPLLNLMLMHLIILLAYTNLITIIFGQASGKFYFLPLALINLLISGLKFGSFDLENLEAHSPYLADFIYSSNCILSIMIIALYITIILTAHAGAKIYFSSKGPNPLKQYLYSECDFFTTLLRVRLCGGNDFLKDHHEYIKPKDDRKMYANCIRCNESKLRIMALTVIFRFKPQLTDSVRVYIMLSILRLLNSSKETQAHFYLVHNPHKVDLMYENKIVQMELFAKILFSSEIQEKKKTKRKRMSKKLAQKQLKQLEFTVETLKACRMIINRIQFITER